MTSTIARRASSIPALALAFLALFPAACGDSQSSTAQGGAGGSPTAGAAGDGGFGVGGGSTGNTISEDSACATAAIEGETLPVTMLIMFDRSASMLEDQKWAGAKAALIAFFQDQDSAGFSVGLRFFPDDAPVPGCNDQACSIDACAQPLVEPGLLTAAPASSDPQQKALVDAVNATSPAGQTPMYAALGGAESWAKASVAKGQKNTVVVLVTDGEPTTCNTDIDAIASLAKDAHDTAGVTTYAIGMLGSDQAQLDKVASAGGTEKALLATAGSVATKLGEALAGIQKAQIACSFDVPAGDSTDTDKINVNYHDGSGKVVTLPKVDSEAACPASYAWYYDDNAAPKVIHLCPATCAEAQGNPDALIKILLGCETIAK
ncbi:MAG: vWA domain-containing protein [Polyangiaceae bacterium]